MADKIFGLIFPPVKNITSVDYCEFKKCDKLHKNCQNRQIYIEILKLIIYNEYRIGLCLYGIHF